ncbi:MAG: hypothetical protein WBM17_11470, partial [Anaerolineales bacterium]
GLGEVGWDGRKRGRMNLGTILPVSREERRGWGRWDGMEEVRNKTIPIIIPNCVHAYRLFSAVSCIIIWNIRGDPCGISF